MNTLIIDGLFVYKNLEKNFDNKSSLEIIYENAKKNNFDRYILIQNGEITDIPQGIKNIVLNNITCKNILQTILEEAKNTQNVIVVDAGNPFYDFKFITNMLDRHNKYIADYTYTIGYPAGLTAQILRKDIMKELITLVDDDDKLEKDYIFYSISKDINSFDIETFLSEKDIRIYRTSIGCSDIGEELFTKKLFKEISDKNDINIIVDHIYNNLDSLYTTLYLLTLELTNYSDAASIYYPDIKENHCNINFNNVKHLINQLKSINDKIQVIFGGIGEPLLHPDIVDLIKLIISNNLNLIIETTALNIDKDFIEKITGINNYENIVFVVKIDAYEKGTYQKIHKNGDFDKVNNAVLLLKEAGFKVYKQIIRMLENEIEIEKFFRQKEFKDIIIRKFSTFCNNLADRKVVDLAPLERIPCFHLRRELYIKSDGSIPACLYSRYNSNIGNINNDKIDDVIINIKKLYSDNCNKNYLDYCKDCNDYYLFNF